MLSWHVLYKQVERVEFILHNILGLVTIPLSDGLVLASPTLCRLVRQLSSMV